MDNRVIDMLVYRGKNSRVFSGRNEGYELRDKLKLEDEDKLERTVLITIPEDTYCINSGYFLGAFGASVRKLGKEKFLSKYKFVANDILLEDIMEDTDRALKTSFAL